MQMVSQQQQQQPMQQGQQMMPQQGMMSSGGKLPKEILRARAESHMSPKEAASYVNNYSRGGKMRYDGGGRKTNSMYTLPTGETQFMSYDENGNPISYGSGLNTQLKPFNPNEYAGNETAMPDGTTFDGNNYNTQTPTEHALGRNNEDILTGYNTDLPYRESYWDDDRDYNKPIVGTAKTPNGLTMNFKSAPQMANQVTELGKLAASNNANTVGQTGDTPWYKEPWYSKIAGPLQAIPGIVGAITALKNKKRRLTPDLASPARVNYEPERIIARDTNNNLNAAAINQLRNSASSAGMLAANVGNITENSKKSLADIINRSVMGEENTNAQFLQQANMTNTGIKNQFKQLNEEMFQNAQTQGVRAIGDIADKVSNYALSNRKQNLQEWIAQNRLGTRSYKTNINGQDVYISADNKVYDAKTGALLGG
jgi:hypothetical protein